MKLSFSINRWRTQTWEDFVESAEEMRIDGIEIHMSRGAAFAEKGGPFHKYNAAATRRALRDKGITLPCISAVCDIADEAKIEEGIEEVTSCIEIAKTLNVPYVRVHAPSRQSSAQNAHKFIDRVLPMAEEAGITLLLETMGIFSDTGVLRDFLNEYACDFLAALWDLHHPYRDHNEAAETTIQNLGSYVRHVHIKDSVCENGEVECRLLGEGSLPVSDFIDALASINYDGFISLEWDPEWLSDLQDIDIILAHFSAYMNGFDNPSRKRGHLYNNANHTGTFVWKKDDLIDCTFSQVLDRMVEEYPDQYVFKYTTSDYTRTYSEFRDDVDEFARALVAMGVKAGTHVAIWATNIPQWFISFWAVTKIGAVLVTVNTAYKVHEAEYLLRQSDTHTLIMIEGYKDSNYIEIMQELCPETKTTRPGTQLHCKRLPVLRNIITVGCRMEGCMTWDEVLPKAESVSAEVIKAMAAAVNVNDVCNMQYTSGTTGFPKGVMLTHYNVVNNGKYIGDHMDLSTADRMLIQVPMFHCFGMVLSMTAGMTHGVTLCPLPYFSPKPALACVTQERITTFNGVPTMFIAMMQHPDFEKTDFSHVRTGIMAGSNCPADLMKQAADIMNMTQIVSVYGQTEASPGCTMGTFTESLERRTETVGKAFANVECKIVDPETGEECPNGVSGEFVVRGYQVMKGYYKMPKATAATIEADGWLHTGDLACRDDEGYYQITGRLKDMIIRGGENLYPREIEEFIFTHAKVQDVQVIGVPDKRLGEEAMACIILNDGETMEIEEMRKYITERLARHKVPKYIEFVTEFPMNAAGKILKYKMREDAAARLGLND